MVNFTVSPRHMEFSDFVELEATSSIIIISFVGNPGYIFMYQSVTLATGAVTCILDTFSYTISLDIT
jgi:hypothetical protein